MSVPRIVSPGRTPRPKQPRTKYASSHRVEGWWDHTTDRLRRRSQPCRSRRERSSANLYVPHPHQTEGKWWAERFTPSNFRSSWDIELKCHTLTKGCTTTYSVKFGVDRLKDKKVIQDQSRLFVLARSVQQHVSDAYVRYSTPWHFFLESIFVLLLEYKFQVIVLLYSDSTAQYPYSDLYSNHLHTMVQVWSHWFSFYVFPIFHSHK